MLDERIKAMTDGVMKPQDMGLEERSIFSVTNELFKSIDMSSGTE
jgi:hypothetical protein